MCISKNFTIIIPCINFEDVEDCLIKIRSVYRSIKIIVCLNKKIRFKNKDKNTKFIYANSNSIGEKRNIAAKAAKTKFLAFIDSDAFPKKYWVENSLKFINIKNVGIVSGPNIDPKKQNYNEEIIGLLKKSFLITMKPGFQRGYIKKPQFVKFLPSVNWILKKEVYFKNNLMNSKMIRNEDWDFVHRLKKLNQKVFYSPNCVVFHKNGSILHFIKKRFKYGFFMWNVMNKINSENFYFFIPFLFCLFLISFPLIFIFNFYLIIYSSVLISFIVVVFFETLRISYKYKYLVRIFILLILCTLSPGFGIMLSIFNNKRN